mgnify:CR=1 FL=1
MTIGVQSGYIFGAGNWQDHRYAPVDQFGNSYAFLADFELTLRTDADQNRTAQNHFRVWSIALVVSHTSLSTADWEDWVNEQGDVLEASAAILHVDAVMRRSLLRSGNQQLRLEFGGGVAVANSEESYLDRTYEYDFLLGTRGEAVLGLLYDWKFGRSFGVTIRAGFTLAGTAVGYADGVNRDITYFPLTAGLRFYP